MVDADGKPVESVVDAGRYTVKAVFTHKDENRGKIEDISAVLYIEKIVADLEGVGFFGFTSIEYDGETHIPEFIGWQEVNGTEFDILSYGTIEYYVRESDGKYVKMGANELPKNIGTYKCTVGINIADEHIANYVLEDNQTSDVMTFFFTINRKVLPTPQVSFDGEKSVTYSGNQYEIDYSYTIDNALMSVSTAYFKQTDNGYVALENGVIPVNAGKYKFVVTVSATDDEMWMFRNSQSSIDFEYEFEIEKMRIDIGALFDHKPTYDYSNGELDRMTFDSLDPEIKKYLNCSVMNVYERYGDGWTSTYAAVFPGYYSVQYEVTTTEPENIILVYNGIEDVRISLYHYFYID